MTITITAVVAQLLQVFTTVKTGLLLLPKRMRQLPTRNTKQLLPKTVLLLYSLATQYAFTYVKDGGHWEATAGSVTITKNENNKISGNYEATAGAGVSGITSMKGTFTDVPVN
jgi:hypothetical protein